MHSIGEKAELISTMYKHRQIDTQEALEQAKAEIEEINKAKKEQAEKNLPKELFSAYWIMKNEQIEQPEEKASKMKPIFEKYPHWVSSEEHERELKNEVIKSFIKAELSVQKSVDLVNKILNVLKSS